MRMAKVVAGNWKMNHGPAVTEGFFERFRPDANAGSVRLVFFPPDLSLAAGIGSARVPADFGVQNIHWEAAGALTGEISAEMAKEAGAALALIGHSERRHVFGETDAEVDRKVGAAGRAGLVPVVCVGELIEERKAGRLEEVLRRQVGAFRASLGAVEEFMVAYEPVWAIGTGETATPDDASEAHAIVRDALGSLGRAPVLYGGSVNPANAAALMSAPDVDGVLVGGASLDPEVFARIAEAGAAVGPG
ncbi:MAG: triose-phosphate isomerase [Gemmatimonadetes bacterium]|nr:triose-phosphate isomerase [Gemmatimonadota bacterium]MYB99549.1 triose-phosphate isomerase [Gemmatimonadota bacterium]